MNPSRCFISYSWDSEPHRAWVRKLATRLCESGIDAILDQFDCSPGADLTKFMEKSVRESNFVLLVCTPNFAQKADAGIGGVGYEKAIVTGEIFAGEARETKFVPLLREGDAKESLPSYLKSRLFVDFRDDAVFENRLEELLRHFYGEPLYRKPPIGPRPKFIITPPSVAPLQKPVLQQKITNSFGMEFVLIPAGSFTMGSRLSPTEFASQFGKDATYYEYEKPVHSVDIERPFYLQTTLVTQGQWKKVMRDNPSFFKKCGNDCPVEQISWEDAQRFIEKLNQLEKVKDYRLPSEAEWEYACRAGSETEFCFGDDPGGLGGYAWYRENSEYETHPVGKKKPNPWGLYDMYGNVWEWVEDDWHDSFEGAPIDGQAWVNNPRDSEGVMRGGGYANPAHGCRSAIRVAFPHDCREATPGFRISRSGALGSWANGPLCKGSNAKRNEGSE
jgi:formylglycine-generating enzyme required for sulfatase activity